MDFIGTAFQLAVESIVTSSTSEPLRFVTIPHIYWSTSRPSSSAGLLENKNNIVNKKMHACVEKEEIH